MSAGSPRPPRSGCPQTTQGASPPGTACCAPLLPVLPPRYALHTKRVWTRRCSHPAHIRISPEADRRSTAPRRCSRDRKSVVSGKRGSVRVDRGGSRLIKKKKPKIHNTQRDKHKT